ncbi:MAG: type VII secretion protein EccB [Propionibacteriaceae bacterium]|jgi:hypothetical protein|nr:type VII secretion protein EccB [Propionibacteriaceae bacterium]
MPSNKDILSAQRFNRRRLVTAFTSGTPGGRELEPKSPVMPLLIGAVVGAVVLAVAAVLGLFAPTLPDGWENNTLLVVKGTGARYYTISGQLHPVANVTSARLLSEAGKFSMVDVDASVLVDKPRGAQVGLSDVPDDVPAPADLRSGQWAACADSSAGNHVWVGSAPAGITQAAMAVVRVGEQFYIVSGGQSHYVNYTTADGAYDPNVVLMALGTSVLDAHPVSSEWLSLFEAGADVGAVGMDRLGAEVTGFSERLASVRIGSVIRVDDKRYLVVDNETILQLTDFAYQMWTLGPKVKLEEMQLKSEIEANYTDLESLKTAQAHASIPSNWPTALTAPIPSDAAPCVSLSISEAGSFTELAAAPHGEWAAVTVAGGSGALVRDSIATGAVRLIADNGFSYSLGVDPTDSLTRLGYSGLDPTPVGKAWLNLVPSKEIDLTNETAKKGG